MATLIAIRVGGPGYNERFKPRELAQMVRAAEWSPADITKLANAANTQSQFNIIAEGHEDAINFSVNSTKVIPGSCLHLVFHTDGTVGEPPRRLKGTGVVYKRLGGPADNEWELDTWIYDGCALDGDYEIDDVEVIAISRALSIAREELKAWIKGHPDQEIPYVIIYTDSEHALDFINRNLSHCGIEGNELADRTALLAGRFAGEIPSGVGHSSGYSMFSLSQLFSNGVVKHMGSDVLMEESFQNLDVDWKSTDVQRHYKKANKELPAKTQGIMKQTLDFHMHKFVARLQALIAQSRLQYAPKEWEEEVDDSDDLTAGVMAGQKRKRKIHEE
ncbi:hypothetical protein F5Y18DRAFT_442890 [Xylariaceae sp. FL1019]|nr:hypothetical protein F5Y18DRAFT_442890 [Xylariaceae sp. FL1019]